MKDEKQKAENDLENLKSQQKLTLLKYETEKAEMDHLHQQCAQGKFTKLCNNLGKFISTFKCFIKFVVYFMCILENKKVLD